MMVVISFAVICASKDWIHAKVTVRNSMMIADFHNQVVEYEYSTVSVVTSLPFPSF